MTFRQALDEHLSAIDARDIERFGATLSRDPAACVVAPDGSTTTGYDAILAAHRGWFAAPTAWRFEPAVRLERASDTLGFALLEVAYHEGELAKRFLLSVVFVREHGSWKLLYDQNTPLHAA